MRTIKLVLLALILIGIVILAIANRDVVTLQLLPEGMAWILPLSVDLPLFVVILLAILLGIVLGYLFEWLREHKYRRRAAREAAEAERLNREVERLHRQGGKPRDDVLAILGSR